MHLETDSFPVQRPSYSYRESWQSLVRWIQTDTKSLLLDEKGKIHCWTCNAFCNLRWRLRCLQEDTSSNFDVFAQTLWRVIPVSLCRNITIFSKKALCMSITFIFFSFFTFSLFQQVWMRIDCWLTKRTSVGVWYKVGDRRSRKLSLYNLEWWLFAWWHMKCFAMQRSWKSHLIMTFQRPSYHCPRVFAHHTMLLWHLSTLGLCLAGQRVKKIAVFDGCHVFPILTASEKKKCIIKKRLTIQLNTLWMWMIHQFRESCK